MNTKALGGVTLALTLLVGCTKPSHEDVLTPTPTSTSSDYQVPVNIHFSEHWIPTPAVDLMSSDGTFIRAFAESSTLKIFSDKSYGPGKLDGSDRGYPGFAHAERTSNWGGWKDDAYGYTTRWVLSFQEAPDNTVTVLVCSYELIRATKEEVPSRPNDNTATGYTLRYHRLGTPPPANQKGPARAPVVSVFGDWYATTYATSESDNQRCFEDPGRPMDDTSPVSSPGWPARPGV
ncbi:Uncharacterised protein [Mycobacteroides abscessus subsp. abscessus]|uniref:hypothetical protein n=1 Tax=Mycobacteroides abscessus TaxID=36809 RepID=UPI000925B292|nr:hypothetical protein [Mycobacteroides abscessus]SHT15925.1 Uncharacterised protein [Mycobacteroides abscessus subsp. abscessus]SHU41365.1 Uncharacterised protein [Mycobacteroides abscessus subsp. abscessus]SHU44859.1 Uncharacterised protein [Mycobacteroides abscessus subsp. abscessus]SHX88355.1 Uncharacterised protein [Mycobacteroides abscessus subsp. abscessus]SIA94162.1 Uncharacterised protein [Mycobacteroides abscessus subsp. abscessus]